MCTTLTDSPQANGATEAFIRIFKRDYVYVNQLPSAAEIIAQFPDADYNESHPHKHLGMRSAHEYLKALS